ncbi:FtsX-like permease family protein [Luethyella okanaganae]|uniref:FtsX-like permease family protein n=1 Tax=Luethyella okanaganae TaxID=69372 RepID=A0ABW1VDU9_9MICO
MILRLAWLLSRPGSTSPVVALLPIVAFGVVTALLLAVLGGAQRFWSWTDDLAFVYQALAVIALMLLVIPLATLGGSAARLSVRRRDDRLATLRLLGATPRTVAAITVLESGALALAGAFAGVVVYLALLPALALIHFRGEALGTASVWLGVPVVLATVAGVIALAAVSAVLGLRRVIISPLGVRTRQDAPKEHRVKLALGAAVIVISVLAMSALQLAGSAVVLIVVLAVSFGGTLAVLNLIGPGIIGAIAKGQARRAKTPERLLAARGVLESPKAAWRQVSGIAMTSFMAVFAGTGVALVDVVSNGAGGESMDPESYALFFDIRTGVVITVVASFLMIACSVGVNQAAFVLDRRELYLSLNRLGMPVTTMDAARGRAVMSPLRITAVGSALCATVLLFPLVGITLIVAPLSLLVIAGVLSVGIGLVWLGLRATRPVLTRVLVEA